MCEHRFDVLTERCIDCEVSAAEYLNGGPLGHRIEGPQDQSLATAVARLRDFADASYWARVLP